MAISAVGTFSSTNGTAITTKSVTTATAGDLIVVFALYLSNTRTITAVTGGTADGSGWSKIASQVDGVTSIEMWWAKVGTPGTANVTVTYSASMAGIFIGYGDRQFTNGTGASTIWAADGTGSGQINGSATTAAYPSKTPSAAGRLYVGYGVGHSVAMVPGSTSGFTYHIDSTDNCFLWNANVSGAVAPTTGVTSSQASVTIGGLLAVAVTAISSTDSGTGADTADVLRASTATDTATAADTAAILRDSTTTDSATGADTASLTQQYTVTDSATGTEVLDATAIEFKSSTDSGTGTDLVVVDIPEIIASGDTASGTETVALARFATVLELSAGSDTAAVLRDSTATDAATGTDTIVTLRQSAVTDTGAGSSEVYAVLRDTSVSDTGVVVDTITVLRVSAVTDTATGTSGTSIGPVLNGDHGVGTEEIIVVEIPFALILPVRPGPVYDLVVVARIPQASGPPALVEIDPIEWKSLTLTNTLSVRQELTATCLLAGLTDGVRQRLRAPDELATELWLYRNGRVVFAGPLLGGQTNGENLSLTAGGLMTYLQTMMVSTDVRFDQVDQFTIVKSLIDTRQALDYGNVGIDTSGVVASGVLRDQSYVRAERHIIGQRIQEMGQRTNGFDIEIDPATRKLQLWYPLKGVDRSTGEDAVIFDERNITSGDIVFSVAPGDLATEAYGVGTSSSADTALWSEKSNLELRAKYGRADVGATWSDVSEQTTLDDHTQAMLDARAGALFVPGPKTRVTADVDLSTYSVGDTVAYELNGQLSISGAFRIRTQRISVTGEGQESVDLEFV